MAKKILVIDDEPELVDVIRKRLEANGYDVLSANNGEEGMEILLRERPDLILLDVRMPKMDGYTFVKEIGINKDVKKTPIIMLTAVDRLKDLFELEGVKDYVVKPFDTETLVSKVKKCLQE